MASEKSTSPSAQPRSPSRASAPRIRKGVTPDGSAACEAWLLRERSIGCVFAPAARRPLPIPAHGDDQVARCDRFPPTRHVYALCGCVTRGKARRGPQPRADASRLRVQPAFQQQRAPFSVERGGGNDVRNRLTFSRARRSLDHNACRPWRTISMASVCEPSASTT